MPNHHPSIELLTSYSAASLPLSQALAVATHLEFCPQCRQEIKRLNRIGAELFDKQASTPSKQHDLSRLKQATLERLDDINYNKEKSPESHQSQQIPSTLQQFIRDGYQQLKWQRISPSLKLATLLRDKDGSHIALAKLRPGGSTAAHTHKSHELTTVLSGNLFDEAGIYGPGDFIFQDQTHTHHPAATKDGECLCLIVLSKPIQLTGFFSRWLNPFIHKAHYAGS